jgi:hypothetical protein
MGELFEQRLKVELDRLLSQLPESQQKTIRAIAAKGADRLANYLEDERMNAAILGYQNDPMPTFIETIRQVCQRESLGRRPPLEPRYKRILSETADRLEEGVALRPALLLAWVACEVDEYLKASQKAENAAQKPRKRLA